MIAKISLIRILLYMHLLLNIFKVEHCLVQVFLYYLESIWIIFKNKYHIHSLYPHKNLQILKYTSFIFNFQAKLWDIMKKF